MIIRKKPFFFPEILFIIVIEKPDLCQNKAIRSEIMEFHEKNGIRNGGKTEFREGPALNLRVPFQ